MQELMAAVRDLVDLYTGEWLLGKTGFLGILPAIRGDDFPGICNFSSSGRFSLLKASSLQGEGHRKVWARLRVRGDAKVGRGRVLRIMREDHLLSPYRGRPEPPHGQGVLKAGSASLRGSRLALGRATASTTSTHTDPSLTGEQLCLRLSPMGAGTGPRLAVSLNKWNKRRPDERKLDITKAGPGQILAFLKFIQRQIPNQHFLP